MRARMSIAPRSPMSESFATNPPDGGESKEGYGRGRFRARFIYCGGGGGVPRFPIPRLKNVGEAVPSTIISFSSASIRPQFSPPRGNRLDGGGLQISETPPPHRSLRPWQINLSP